MVENWLSHETTTTSRTYTRRQAAEVLDTTPEAIRNWERNGLIQVPRRENGHRVYGSHELERLQVIRSLRTAHYSINAIYRLLKQLDQPNPDIIKILNTPVTDQLVSSLLSAITDAKTALALFVEQI